MDTPLGVMVPKLLVPVVEGFRCEELAGFYRGTIWERPVAPEGEMNAVQSIKFPGSLSV
jgi:hypothetical protein